MRRGSVSAFAAAWLLSAATGSARQAPDGLSPDAWAEIAQRFEAVEQAKLTASDAATGQFGFAVSLCGDTVVVGNPFDDHAGSTSGSAYVFERDQGGLGSWGEVTKLTASDPDQFDFFGGSVSVSGDTVVLGAPGHDHAGSNSGSVYVFERDQGGPDNWGQVTELTASDAAASDNFGLSVSVSGDTVVVGAPSNDDAGSASGSAYVFERDQGGPGNWGEVAKLTASDAAAGDEFGSSVSVSGDAVLVAAHLDDDAGSASGSAYLFERDQGGPGNWGEVAKLTASDAAAGDELGSSASVSADTAVLGAPFDHDAGAASGSAYVFERDQGGPGNWGEVTKLTASDAAAGDEFGSSASVSGARAVVGARFDDDAGLASGSAYVFERDHGGLDSWGEASKLTASDAAADHQFGFSTSLSGDTVVVGAPRVVLGSAYVYLLPADLAIDKTDKRATAVPGESLTYIITVTNLGPFAASGATVTDLFPVELSCTWTCAGGGGATCTPGPVAGDIADSVNLPVGSVVAFAATCALDPAATGTLLNTATVSHGLDPEATNNSATDADLITPQADLGITKTDKQATAVPGESLTYIITATNFGPIDVTGATVTDLFPAALTCAWTCVASGGATCTAAGSGNIVESLDLPVGDTATFLAVCAIDPAATGAVVNTTTVSPPAGVTDPFSSNNSASDVDALTPEADLAVTKDDGQTTAVPGGTTTYTITASNPAGPSDAPGSAVADVFSSLLSCTWTCTGSGGASCTPGPIAGDIADTADLPLGGAATYTAACDINSGAAGTVTNTAAVTAVAGVTDPAPGDNSATDVDTLTPEADLAITKDDGITVALPGDELTYTIVASNPGPSDVLAATVEDVFPPELIDCEWTCAADPGALCTGGPVAGDIADSVDLPAGTTVTYSAVCTVNLDGGFEILSNTVSITEPAGVTDPNPGNNAATDLDFGTFMIFTDGFESGDTSAWSLTVP